MASLQRSKALAAAVALAAVSFSGGYIPGALAESESPTEGSASPTQVESSRESTDALAEEGNETDPHVVTQTNVTVNDEAEAAEVQADAATSDSEAAAVAPTTPVPEVAAAASAALAAEETAPAADAVETIPWQVHIGRYTPQSGRYKPVMGGDDYPEVLKDIQVTLAGAGGTFTSNTVGAFNVPSGSPLYSFFTPRDIPVGEYQISLTGTEKLEAAGYAIADASVAPETVWPRLALLTTKSNNGYILYGTLADLREPKYKAMTAEQNHVTESDAPTFDHWLTPYDNEKDAVPAGTSFSLGDGAPLWVEVNGDTGKVKATPKSSVPVGTVVNVPVVVTYPGDGGTDTSTVRITVEAPTDQSLTYSISRYLDGTQEPFKGDDSCQALGDLKGLTVTLTGEDGKTYTSGASDSWNCSDTTIAFQDFGGTYIPTGTYTVEINNAEIAALNGYSFVVDNFGNYGGHPVHVSPGSTLVVDGSLPNVFLDLLPYQYAYVPNYSPLTVYQGGDATVEAPTFDTATTATVETDPAPSFTAGGKKYTTTFAKADGAPDWVESVDAATGAIKVKPGYSVEPKTYDVPVTVTFPGTNGGSTTAVAKVTVEAANAQNVTFGISVGNQWLGGTNSCEALGNLKDGVSIVLVAEDGTKYRSDVNGWGCPDNFPAYQGFGEKLIPFGDYTVIVEGEDTIADEGYVIDVPNYPYTTYAYPNATISIDGKRGQIYLDLLPFNKAYTPSYTAISVNQGDEGTVVAPTFDNTLTSDVETGAAPEGTTFAKADGAPDWVESVDAATGAIKVKPGYSVEPKTYDVPVTVTFPGTNGGTTDAIAKVTVTTKSTTPGFDPNGTDEDGNPFVVNPSANGSQECGVKPYIVLPADAGVIYTVKDAKGAVVTPDVSGHYVIAYGTEVTVTAAPGEGYSFPEGATTTWTVTVEKTAECQPSWDDATTIPGEPITVPNTGGPVDEGTTVEVDGPGTAVINPDGSITVTPGDDAKPGDTITVTVKDPNGKTIDEITVTIDDTPTTPTFDPNGTDEDGNPFVVNPSADDPAECTVKPYVVLPNDEGVTYVVTDANGNVIEPDASGHYVYAYGTEVTVTASPAEGFAFPADATTTWTFSSQKAAVCEPKWEDSTTKPGEPITVPNTGGPVDEGTTIEVDGPGTAVINPDGSITVTPGDDAKPGDTITVTVKDPNGKTIDEMTITIGKPDAQPTKPAPAAATLPFTGASAIGFGIAAAVLVLGGGVVLFGAKARREK